MRYRQAQLCGLLAEFADADALLAAARSARDEGYREMETYSPYSIEEMSEVIPVRRAWVSLIVLIGGILGGAGGFFMCYYAMAISYPFNIGGRPLNSWPMFIPITFELTVLGAALFGAFGMLALNGLPRLHHPLFNVPAFHRASQDRFFLYIRADDPKFDVMETRHFLEIQSPNEVSDVED